MSEEERREREKTEEAQGHVRTDGQHEEEHRSSKVRPQSPAIPTDLGPGQADPQGSLLSLNTDASYLLCAFLQLLNVYKAPASRNWTVSRAAVLFCLTAAQAAGEETDG